MGIFNLASITVALVGRQLGHLETSDFKWIDELSRSRCSSLCVSYLDIPQALSIELCRGLNLRMRFDYPCT